MLSLAAAALPASAASGAERIITLPDGTNAAAHAAALGVTPTQVYDTAISGYAAELTPAQEAKVKADPTVAAVVADRKFTFAGKSASKVKVPAASKSGGKPKPAPPSAPSTQIIGTHIKRISGLLSPTAKIDGLDQRVDADIAIIDTGVARDHEDLNVAATVGCAGRGSGNAPFGDHGTGVAGLAAALDNGVGVVGSAPGARIWSVRVVADNGEVVLSSLLCATDWVARNASRLDVANMSITGPGEDTGCDNRGQGSPTDPLHISICRAVNRGVTFTVAAGNSSSDAATESPANYDEVITVSALADFDGKPGGLSAPLCLGDELPEEDDTFAVFSNFGADVDIAAPGVCNRTTSPLAPGYGVGDGTSFSAPLVAGAAALIKARNPRATPAQVKATLIQRGEPGPLPQDPDTFPEPLLNVAGL